MELFNWEKKAGKFVLAVTVLGMLWGFGEFTETRPAILKETNEILTLAQANTKALLLLQFQQLETKRKNGGLTTEEKILYCHITAELGFKGTGCS